MVERFRCSFWDDVFCSFKRSDKSVFMSRCLKCPHYKKFEREMEREELEFWDEVDRTRGKGH